LALKRPLGFARKLLGLCQKTVGALPENCWGFARKLVGRSRAHFGWAG